MSRLFSHFFAALLFSVPLMGAAPGLEFSQAVPTGLSFGRALPLANGQTLLIARAQYFTLAERSGSFSSFLGSPTTFSIEGYSGLTLLDATGAVIPNAITLGSGTSFISDAAVDASGNIWLAGETTSDDFPLVAPLFTKKIDYASTAFVLKLDPTLTTILFSTFLGGPSGGASVAALALDPVGNVYVTGTTSQLDFPTTVPALGPVASSPTPPTTFEGFAFVSKILGDGSRLAYGVLLGGSQSSASSGAFTQAQALAVDASGDVTVGGMTNAIDFPTTAGAFQTSSPGNSFLSRLSPDGTKLQWSTYFTPKSATGLQVEGSLVALRLDAAGDVYAAFGVEDGLFIGIPAGIIVSTSPAPAIAMLSADGGTLLGTLVLGGGDAPTSLNGIALDSGGSLWVTGTSQSASFPSVPGELNLGNDFAIELNANATAATQIFRLPTGSASAPPSFDVDGNIVLLSARGAVLRFNPASVATTPAVFAIENAALLTADAGFVPGELVTLLGVGLGPANRVAASPANGLYPTQLGGVSVSVGGVAAPLLYVGPNQINLQVPFEFTNSPGAVIITTPTGALQPILVPTLGSIGIFQSTSGFAAALNQDQTVNSATNPAAPGSIVTIFATGLNTGAALKDGAIWSASDPSPLSEFGVEVTTNPSFAPLNLFYAGPAPGLINGVYQFNVQLPQSLNVFSNPGFTLIQLPGTTGSNYVQVYTPASGFIWSVLK